MARQQLMLTVDTILHIMQTTEDRPTILIVIASRIAACDKTLLLTPWCKKTHTDDSRGSIALIRVCLWLCPYNRSKTAETTITELTIGIVHSIMSPGYQFNIWSKDQFTGSQSAKTFQAIDGRRKL